MIKAYMRWASVDKPWWHFWDDPRSGLYGGGVAVTILYVVVIVGCLVFAP